MKLILEKDEVVRILGQHFEAVLDPTKVIIRTEPVFEIELTGLPLTTSNSAPPPMETPSNVVPLPTTSKLPALSAAEEKAILARADDNATTEAPPPGLDDIEPSDETEIHPAAMLAKSAELAEALDRENPQLARQRRGGSPKAPTSDYRDEI